MPSRAILAITILGVGIALGREPNRHGSKADLRPQTFPIRATAGFETGVVTLARVVASARPGDTVEVDWGDASSTPAFFARCGPVTCDILGTHTYEVAGDYTITIRVSKLLRREKVLTTSAVVSPPSDFVILSIGDSVASGEGSPVVSRLDGGPVLWDDTEATTGASACHRSSLAGPAAAARRVVEARDDVTFIHKACSGANTSEIIEQLWQVRQSVHRLDVLIISGGANNIAGGFGALIGCCFEPFLPCELLLGGGCHENAELERRVADDIAALTDDYADLALAINCMERDPTSGEPVPDPRCDGLEHPVPSAVLITEYFDPTHDRRGEFPSHLTTTTCAVHQLNPAEWQFLYEHMVVPLNEAVAAAAKAHGWIAVGGLAEQFLEHGYCASPGPGSVPNATWIVKVPESLRLQGDVSGTGHPNLVGQEAYADAIHAELTKLAPASAE